MKKIKLFCLPHAGGFAMHYIQWKNYVNKNVEVIPVELSGHGRRMSEDFYKDFNSAIDDLAGNICKQLDGSQFAIFGHSMGTTLAYELAYKIIEMKNQEPIKLFLSGRRPPHIIQEKKRLYLLPDNEFIEEVKNYGGISEEVLKEKELMDMVLPVLKADFKIIDTYEYMIKNRKLNCDIVAFTGKDDFKVNTEELLEWKEYTNGKYYLYEFDGGHFYINDNINKIISIINEKLES